MMYSHRLLDIYISSSLWYSPPQTPSKTHLFKPLNLTHSTTPPASTHHAHLKSFKSISSPSLTTMPTSSPQHTPTHTTQPSPPHPHPSLTTTPPPIPPTLSPHSLCWSRSLAMAGHREPICWDRPKASQGSE